MMNEEVLEYLKNTNKSPYEFVLMRISKEELGIVIEALEKQIQKEPEKRIVYNTNINFGRIEIPVAEYYCSKCGKRIYVSENFCTQCGQKIDWSKEDD